MSAPQAATYGVAEFVADARRIMEAPDGMTDREAAVRALEPLLKRALDGPGWEDPRYATVTEGGRPGFEYYRNPETSLHIYGVLFRPEHPTPVHDHVTWGIIGVYSGTQRTTRYRREDDGSTPGAVRSPRWSTTSTASRSSRANPASENLDTDNWTGQADPERAKASAEKLKAIAAREGATMIYGHDPAVWAGLRLAPAYYE